MEMLSVKEYALTAQCVSLRDKYDALLIDVNTLNAAIEGLRETNREQRQERDGLVADKARLDFLESHHVRNEDLAGGWSVWIDGQKFRGNSLREVADVALKWGQP